MTRISVFAALLLSLCSAQAQQSYEPKEVPGLDNMPVEKTEPAAAQVSAPLSATKAKKAQLNEFCLFKGLPPSNIKFEQLGHVKHAKGTYGAAREIVPVLISKAE